MFLKKIKVLFFFFLTALHTIHAQKSTPPFLNVRSISRDSATALVGTARYTHLDDMETYYGFFSVRPGYKESFNSSHITSCLFGDALSYQSTSSRKKVVRIAGTGELSTGNINIKRNDGTDLMAEHFYLPRDFKSTLSFDPKVQSFILDFHFYCSFDEWCRGLFLHIYGPFVHSRYDLQFCESNISFGNNNEGQYAAGFFGASDLADATINTKQLLNSFTAYSCGQAPTNVATGIKPEGLLFAKIPRTVQTKNGLADLRFVLGYDVVLDEDYHLGASLQISAPTGSRPKGEFLFEPQCGNNKHWELGIGITSHYVVWQSDCNDDHHLDIWCVADIAHLFNAKQIRTFDIQKKPLSRYMLAMQFDEKSVGPLVDADNLSQIPEYAFNGIYAPVANISTQHVRVSANIQLDSTIMLNYASDYFGWNFGYNIWFFSCEKIRLNNANNINIQRWALKGDAAPFGFVQTTQGNLTQNDGIALSATQSGATIHCGTNKNDPSGPLSNPNIDNRHNAGAQDGSGGVVPLISAIAPQNIVQTSIQPLFIEMDDLDIVTAATRGLSHKIFTHIHHTWFDYEDWIPFIGIGVDIEFGHNDHVSTTRCATCTLSQWSVWIKTGWTFN